MWATGTIETFENRLHLLPTGVSDLLTGFIPEGLNYTGMAAHYQSKKWNTEVNKKWYQFTSIPLETGRWFY